MWWPFFTAAFGALYRDQLPIIVKYVVRQLIIIILAAASKLEYSFQRASFHKPEVTTSLVPYMVQLELTEGRCRSCSAVLVKKAESYGRFGGFESDLGSDIR